MIATARKIEIEIVGDGRSLERAFGRAGRSAGGFGRALHTLARTAAVAGAAIGAGVVVGLEKSVHAAVDAEKQTARLDQAFKNAHLSARTYAKSIHAAEAAGRKLGFTDNETMQSLGSLLTATGNVTKARKDLTQAYDIARFTGKSLVDSTKMLTMAMTGSQRAAKQLGITVSPVTKNFDALAKGATKAEKAHAKLLDKFATGNAVIAAVNAKLHGQAAAYAQTAAGGLDKFKAAMEHLQVWIGTKFLPILSAAAGGAAAFFGWLEKLGHAKSLKVAVEMVIAKGESIKNSLQAQLDKVDWGLAGRRIGQALSAGIVLTGQSIDKFIALVASRSQAFADLGLTIALTMVARIFDPGFWLAHWKLLVALASIVLLRGLGKVAGEAAGAFIKTFLSAPFRAMFRRLEVEFYRLPPLAQTVARLAGRVISEGIGAALKDLQRLFGRVPGWITAAFKIGAIIAVIGAIQKVVGWIQRLFGWLSKIAGKAWDIVVNIKVHAPGGKIAGKVAGAIGGAIKGLIPGVQAKGGLIEGGIPGVDSVPILAMPGEVIVNPRDPKRGLAALKAAGIESFARGGKVKHRAPHLPGSIREAEARAAGTPGLGDDISAKTREEHWIEGELARHDLTRSEREGLRVKRIRVRNSLRSLRRRQAKANKKKTADYSQLPAHLQYNIDKARLDGDNVKLLAALQAGERWYVRQLARKGLTYAQRSGIINSLISIRDEIKNLQAQGTQDTSADLQAELDQANARLGVAQRSADLANAFVNTGIFGGGPGGGAPPGGGMPSFGFYELGDSRMLGRATGAIVTGLGRQGYRQSNRERLGV